MKPLFADTFYYLAMVNPRDAAHREAVSYSQKRRVRTVTTAWVLTEVADALAASVRRLVFLSLLRGLQGNPAVRIIPAGQDLFEQGIRLYAKRPDKDWPLTDCISFVVMKQMKLTDALTGDRHFEQAGFRALLK